MSQKLPKRYLRIAPTADISPNHAVRGSACVCDLIEDETAWCVWDDVRSDLTFSETDALAEVDRNPGVGSVISHTSL